MKQRGRLVAISRVGLLTENVASVERTRAYFIRSTNENPSSHNPLSLPSQSARSLIRIEQSQ